MKWFISVNCLHREQNLFGDRCLNVAEVNNRPQQVNEKKKKFFDFWF